MRKMLKTVKTAKAAAALTLAAGVVATLGASSAQAAGAYEGCPYGAVCIYPRDAGFNNGHPSDVYYSYGAHNLSGQLGQHIVLNNQSGGATMHFCNGYNGTDCVSEMNANTYTNWNLTPTNSLTLDRP